MESMRILIAHRMEEVAIVIDSISMVSSKEVELELVKNLILENCHLCLHKRLSP
jgi:hypothetical protein